VAFDEQFDASLHCKLYRNTAGLLPYEPNQCDTTVHSFMSCLQYFHAGILSPVLALSV